MHMKTNTLALLASLTIVAPYSIGAMAMFWVIQRVGSFLP